MTAPVVMSFLAKRVRDGGMTMSGLGNLLQRESATIRNALPAGMSELFWPGTATVGTTASPVVAQAVEKESSFNWLPLLAIAGLGAAALLWFMGHARRPSIEAVTPAVGTGTANRIAIPTPKMVCSPTNLDLPAGSVGARLLSFVQNPDASPATGTWFNIEEAAFDSGSTKLRPEAEAQLNNVATILASCPSVRLDVAGYTDSVGNAESNLRLSRNRANAVVADLASKGVSPDRLTAEGYGEEAVADNSSEQGRAQNRRFAIRVTQK
jgi:outer membrane protein OmpA-like peptidoglycan-associated protein